MRVATACLSQPRSLCALLRRVYVQGNKKRGPIPLKGKEAVVMKVLGRGTVFLEAPGSGDPPTRLQQKCAADATICSSMPLMPAL